MQDPGIYDQVKPQFSEHEHLKCPRCDSSNTKFCYYNNYNLSQPRHFCKNCRRYWTKGGTLRNIPVGGGSRKNNKRSSNPKRQANSMPDSEPARIRKQPDSSASSAQTLPPPGIQPSPLEPNPIRPYGLPAITGSFSSLLSANEQFGNLLDPNGSGLKTAEMRGFGMNLDAGRDLNADSGQDPRVGRSNHGENYGEDSSCWGGGSSGWPDLAIYTPSSNFQ